MTYITPDMVQHAFDILRDENHEAARARAAHEYMQDYIKVLKARLEGDSVEKTQSGRERAALSHPDYAVALQQKRETAEQDYSWRDKRSSAMAILDAWRTQCSNERAVGGVR